MNNEFCCPFCGYLDVKEVEVSRVVRDIRTSAEYTIQAFETECRDCGEHFVTPAQSDKNDVRLVEAKGQAIGAPTREEIRTLRNKWDITQAVAGDLFGGGKVAFCKYEAGTIVPTQAMARLLALAVAGRISKVDLEQAAAGTLKDINENVQWESSSKVGSVTLAPVASVVFQILGFSNSSYSFASPVRTGASVFDDIFHEEVRNEIGTRAAHV
jgi:putative zinc finger/helix-turn-helix YgiT family protein